MVAKARGYYEAEGLKVTFLMGKGGVDVAKQVGAGNALVGGGVGDTPLIVRGNEIPVKAVAVLGGKGLMQLVMNEAKGITAPEQLKGRKVTTMSYQDTTYYALLGMLAKVGLKKDDLNIEAAGPAGTWKLFLSGDADAMASVPDWTALAEAQGMKMKVVPAESYFPNMAQAILASDEAIEKKPEMIRKLVRATVKGMVDIMKDPAGAARDYGKAVPENADKLAYITRVFELYNEYVYSGQKVPGEIDPARLASVQDFYVANGIVRTKVPVEQLYSNKFVGN
jgi:NitT/TauT family transport system substrate-binding protein